MKSETKQWINYANENLQSSKVLLKSYLFNPTLQNTQQAIEKYIKSYLVEKNIKLKKTHNIRELNNILKENNILLNITDDEIDLIDSIYLSSKYPMGAILPDFEPDEEICLKCIDIATRVKEDIENILNN